MSPDDPRHGTTNGYGNLNCRCDSCREAWRVYNASKPWQANYRRKKGHIPMDIYRQMILPSHGTESRYQHGCRCDKCREASAAARRRRRIAAKQR